MARRRRRSARILILLLLGLVLAAVGWWREVRVPVLPSGAAPVSVLVQPGMSVAEIGRALYTAGLVRHPMVFRALVVERGVGGRLKAGEYRFDASVTPEAIVEALVHGDVVRHDVTFPEGKTLDEMAQIAAASGGVRAADFLAAAREPRLIRDLDPEATDLEGYLFPDTYRILRTPDAAATLVSRMVARFRKVVTPLVPLARERGLTLRQLVTLASLVELETAAAAERPRIAAVFLNRLKKKMLLQTDPTIIFALRKAGRYDGNIRKQDLEIDSPYNTYHVVGLPPGPIASPGRASLEAVVHPAQVQDLYFVSRNDGTHEFNVRLRDHERAVDRYQRRRGAGG